MQEFFQRIGKKNRYEKAMEKPQTSPVPFHRGLRYKGAPSKPFL
jgi:hypothetical protein